MSNLLKFIITFLAFLALWLVMSGLFKPLLIAFGVISSLLCAGLVAHFGFFRSGDDVLLDFRLFRLLRYLGWLMVEIGRADWAVTKVILASNPPRRQRLIRVPVSQRTDLGIALFANSITITPGTITVEVEDGHFLVHALTDEAADLSGLERMNQNVLATERPLSMARA